MKPSPNNFELYPNQHGAIVGENEKILQPGSQEFAAYSAVDVGQGSKNPRYNPVALDQIP